MSRQYVLDQFCVVGICIDMLSKARTVGVPVDRFASSFTPVVLRSQMLKQSWTTVSRSKDCREVSRDASRTVEMYQRTSSWSHEE